MHQLKTDLLEVLTPRYLQRYLTEAGIPQEGGHFSSIAERLVSKILPFPDPHKDLYRDINDGGMSLEIFQAWVSKVFIADIKPQEGTILATILDQTMLVLSSRLLGLANERTLYAQTQWQELGRSPFFDLHLSIIAQPCPPMELIEKCWRSLERIRQNLDQSGVTLSLLFKLQVGEKILQRLFLLQHFLSHKITMEQLMVEIYRSQLHESSIGHSLQRDLRILCNKIIERSSLKGENYIARSFQEKNSLFISALWGGVLTAVTAIVKYSIGHQQLPLLIEFLFTWLNYSLSFLLMQRWHFILSSKIPANFAAAIGQKVEESLASGDRTVLKKELRDISLSQVLSAAGNVLAVIPICLGIGAIYQWLTGAPIMGLEYAEKTFTDHNPIASGLIFYSSLTGVLLFAASALSSWLENWLLYRRVDELAKVKRSDFVDFLGNILTNIIIGLFLSIPSLMGKLTGLPIDIRHITLASGSLGYAWMSKGFSALHWSEVLLPLIGVVCIGICNFGVSFVLSYSLAVYAKGLPRFKFGEK